MTAPPEAPPTAPPVVPPAQFQAPPAGLAPAAPPPPPAVPEPPATDAKRSLADLLGALPEDDQKIVLDQVAKARDEAKGLRARLKESDPAKAKSDLLAELAKAAGIGTDTPPDPAALAAQLNEQTTAASHAQRELAVFKAASFAGANANALLDSVSFMRTLADVDPSDGEAVTEAIKAALTANPTLSTAPAKRVPGPNPAMGGSANGAPDLEAAIADAQKRGDHMTVIRLQNQKLTAPARQQ